ncbi:MAG: F0F1 ATP synthase subunit A [Phycisphaerae bacterium]|nr:F0F1 ATP synthase subunit A [Phycisphaerae bacterium]
MTNLLASSNPLTHVVQHPYVEVPFALLWTKEQTILSNQIMMMIVAGVLLIVFLPRAIRGRRNAGEVEQLTPKGAYNFIESICQYFRKEVAEPALGPHTDRFIKYIWSAFFFVLTVNLLGLIPFDAVAYFVTGMPAHPLHIGGTATANIYTTGTLAVCTLIMMVVNGFRLGGKAYLAHFCPGPAYMAPLMIPVEIIGLFAKIFALAVRLFANMMAGHILLAVLIGFTLSAFAVGAGMGIVVTIPVIIGSVAINFLELFVAFLQAFIFTFLTTLFIGMSVNVHHDEHEHAEGQAAAH